MGRPERIVCLTGETTETLYLLGEPDRVVGISGYTVRPPGARREKPRVSAFTSADVARIEALRPKFRPEPVAVRPGWAEAVPAVQHGLGRTGCPRRRSCSPARRR